MQVPLLQTQQEWAGKQQQEQQQDEAVLLCAEGRLLAELHAGLLRCCSSIALSGGGKWGQVLRCIWHWCLHQSQLAACACVCAPAAAPVIALRVCCLPTLCSSQQTC